MKMRFWFVSSQRGMFFVDAATRRGAERMGERRGGRYLGPMHPALKPPAWMRGPRAQADRNMFRAMRDGGGASLVA
jgi:hypothetical protein